MMIFPAEISVPIFLFQCFQNKLVIIRRLGVVYAQKERNSNTCFEYLPFYFEGDLTFRKIFLT